MRIFIGAIILLFSGSFAHAELKRDMFSVVASKDRQTYSIHFTRLYEYIQPKVIPRDDKVDGLGLFRVDEMLVSNVSPDYDLRRNRIAIRDAAIAAITIEGKTKLESFSYFLIKKLAANDEGFLTFTVLYAPKVGNFARPKQQELNFIAQYSIGELSEGITIVSDLYSGPLPLNTAKELVENIIIPSLKAAFKLGHIPDEIEIKVDPL